jgi:predicted lipase
MSKTWDELQDDLRRVVFRSNADEVAQQIPASRSTVYRIITGEIQRPSRAIRAGVERLVDGSSQVGQRDAGRG